MLEQKKLMSLSVKSETKYNSVSFFFNENYIEFTAEINTDGEVYIKVSTKNTLKIL